MHNTYILNVCEFNLKCCNCLGTQGLKFLPFSKEHPAFRKLNYKGKILIRLKYF